MQAAKQILLSEICQDINNTVEEYMALNRAQLSVSERLLAVSEQLLASQLRRQ